MDGVTGCGDSEQLLIDIFCGAGGTSLGFKKAGFSVALGVDNDPSCVGNFTKNIGAEILMADMFNTNGDDILSAADLEPGEVTICLGCPPCQGFSPLNGKGGRDRRNSLVHRYTDTVAALNPLFFIFENVPGIMERERFFDAMLHRVAKNGYRTASKLVDMRNHGVPQRRRRVVVVGCRDPKIMRNFSFPPESHAKESSIGMPAWRTVRAAIKDLPPLAAGQSSKMPNHTAGLHTPMVMKRIRAVPKDGGSRRQMPKSLWYRCHRGVNGFNDVMGRMAWDEPSPTITSGCCNVTKGRFIHPSANRAITPREAARLQTFPDDFIFYGWRDDICRQIGNAFPPFYAERLARNVLSAIQAGRE